MGKTYYVTDGTYTIPTTGTGLRKLAEAGHLTPKDLVLVEGMTEWVPAARLKGLFPEPAATARVSCPVVEAELLTVSEPTTDNVPVAKAIPLAKAVPLARVVSATKPAADAEPVQPKGAIDRMCGWVAEKVQTHTGVEVSPETVKVVGGVTLAVVALDMAAKAAGGGSSAGTTGGMGRHLESTTSQINTMQGIIDTGGTPVMRYS